VTDETWARFRAAARDATDTVFWHPIRTPAEVLRSLADAADELDVTWDQYAVRGPVAQLEDELTEIFGTEGAAFFPSGTMAQQAALRVWCDQAGTCRVAMPDIAHPLVHESDGPRRLHGFEVEHLTTGQELATAGSLAAIPGRLGAVLVELPLRDAGCALPTWEQLTELSTAVRERGVRLHVDGARIWESQPFYDRPFAEIAGLADSMYVSFYKVWAASPAPRWWARPTSSTRHGCGAAAWAGRYSGRRPRPSPRSSGCGSSCHGWQSAWLGRVPWPRRWPRSGSRPARSSRTHPRSGCLPLGMRTS